MQNINKAASTIPDIDLLFETSWEVCNKVGGIHTVLSTKAAELKRLYADKLIFIGPDFKSSGREDVEFLERKTLLKKAHTTLTLPYGLKIRVGRWDIPGSPLVVLVDFRSIKEEMNVIYGDMWQHFGVDSLHAYGDYDESCEFGVASAIVMQEIAKHLKADPEKVIGHFNEWTTGMGLLWLQQNMPQAATLFTTHATGIGRSICGNGKDLYAWFDGYNGDQMAQELNMESKHSLEKQAAHHADCFTAVSELTAKECRQLLDIRPQVVTPNGFEPDFIPSSVTYSRLRSKGRERLLNIASALRGKEYGKDTLIVATSGRNEYRNKGLDLFLDSIDRVNEIAGKREIVAFLLVPAWVSHPNNFLLDAIKDNRTISDGPDYLTHRLNNESEDSASLRIQNLERDGRLCNVSVIYLPCYLDGRDGVIDIKYYDLLPAIDLTVFPSYYEPWGYTPLESIAFGVPTITTDKSGFGQWIAETSQPGLSSCGVEVIARNDDSYIQAVDAISENIISFADKNRKERKEISELATATALRADWKFFIVKYTEAFNVALKRAKQRNA